VGKGSFGEVFRGTWNGTEVAVKKLNLPTSIDEANFIKEFKNEVEIMRSLMHPNVIQFLGASFQHPDICIVTEYMPRGSLYKILHSPQPLSIGRLRFIALDAAKGMAYLHSSNPVIIHRDLKSHNLLIDEHWKTKVADFGMSKILGIPGDASHMTACGTPSWTAPEILKNQNYTEKADVYSFAIVLWEMVTREDPYKGIAPFQVVLAVGTQGARPPLPVNGNPKWLELIQRCWAEDFNTRPSFEELIDILEKFPDSNPKHTS